MKVSTPAGRLGSVPQLIPQFRRHYAGLGGTKRPRPSSNDSPRQATAHLILPGRQGLASRRAGTFASEPAAGSVRRYGSAAESAAKLDVRVGQPKVTWDTLEQI